MRWFWFATFTLICSLLSVFFRQPLILIGEIFLIDLFITRKVKWLFWRETPISPGRKFLPGWLNMAIWLAVTIWIIRVLAIDSITVLSTANKPQLQPGDNILVSKIHFGPRLPVTHQRLAGLLRINRGDLVAYNFPEGDSTIIGNRLFSYYSLKRKQESENGPFTKISVRFHTIDRRDPEISRCAGLPGDTITIRADSSLTAANPLLPAADRLLPSVDCRLSTSFDYLVEVNNRQLPQEFLNQLGLGPSEVQILPGLGYLLPLSTNQVDLVRRRPEVTSITAYFMGRDRGDYNIFPHDARYPWNRDNFGPVIVPRKGDSIRLTLLNLCIYQRIIEVYEKNRLEVRQDSIYINGSSADTYTFKQDYYFVLGDNRHHSRDSRHWGFLPEDHIIGKPVLIWFSADRNTGQPFRIYWNRIFNIP
jgi:signal peptidase I